MKFRKKPVVIEAFHMTSEAGMASSTWPEWLSVAYRKGVKEGGLWLDRSSSSRSFLIGTAEGVHQVTWGDWIIQGIKGEIYPCKNDIFEATYEKVE